MNMNYPIFLDTPAKDFMIKMGHNNPRGASKNRVVEDTKSINMEEWKHEQEGFIFPFPIGIKFSHDLFMQMFGDDVYHSAKVKMTEHDSFGGAGSATKFFL